MRRHRRGSSSWLAGSRGTLKALSGSRRPRVLGVVVVGPAARLVSRVRDRLEASECAEDRVDPRPVGGQVEGHASSVAGELAGDVEDPVAMPTSA